MTESMKRILGKSGIEVSALGFGCWPIGGLFYLDGKPDGYSGIDDNESIKAIHRAIDLGVNFFDTADVYGAGHSEKIIGKALNGKRDKVIIATKFGFVFDENTKYVTGTNATPAYIRKACESSLKRLNTDYIDLYQLHLWSMPLIEAQGVFNTLEQLKKEGLIREYGWSTDNMECINFLINKTNCISIQNEFNVFINADKILDICEKNNITSINRSPLAMGLLSGKYNENSELPEDDIRGNNFEWNRYFWNKKPTKNFLDKLQLIKEILTSNRRTLVQGALAWIWRKSEKTIPIPGFRTVKQVEENSKAMEYGPLTKDQINEIDQILNDKVII